MDLDSASLPAPTAEELEAFQRWVGREFPDDFIRFLQSHNGYRPESPVPVGNHALYRFTPLLSNEQTEQNLERSEWSTEMNSVTGDIDGRLFVGDGEAFTYIPVAELSIGDYLCLDYSQPGPPAIAIWDHEQSEDSAAVGFRVAMTFTELVSQVGLEFLLG